MKQSFANVLADSLRQCMNASQNEDNQRKKNAHIQIAKWERKQKISIFIVVKEIKSTVPSSKLR